MSCLTLWPRPGKGDPPELTTPLTKDTSCIEILGGGRSSCVIGSASPGVSVSGASEGVTALRHPAASRNRETLFGTAGGAESKGLVPI